MMKKGKGFAAPRLDDRRPTKAAPPPPGGRAIPWTGDVEVPSYGGPKKTDKKPSRKGRQTGRTKAALKPDTVRRVLVREVIEPLTKKFPTPDGEQGFEHGRLHSFRHFFCSTCANKGCRREW